MKRILSVVAVAAMVAVTGMTVSSPVQARDEGAIIGGVVGGLALGAIIGGAASQQRGYREPGPGYGYQSYGYQSYGHQPTYAGRRQMCVDRQQVWSNRHQAYIVRNVRVPCY